MGYSSARFHFFLATELKRAKQKTEEDESISVLEVSQRKLLKMVKENKIDDLCIIPAILYYLNFKNK